MAFKKYKQELDDHGTSAVYVPLQIGKPVKVLVVGEETTGPAVFIEGKGYIQGDYDQGGRLRFAIHAVHDKCGKILDGPETLYREIGKLSEMVDIEKNVIAIEKISNKKYEVRGLQQLTDAQVAKAAGIKFPDIGENIGWVGEVTAPAGAPTPPPAADDDPFGDAEVDDSMAANPEEDDLPI